jgi:hypothetical protein
MRKFITYILLQVKEDGWAGYVVRMDEWGGKRGMHIGYWWERQKKETNEKTKT